MPIRILDAETISRIAAGEVVERPASIAKELIENAIDAGATSITVEIRDGGISYLRITDNGCGIPANETRFAFTNHATSKLQNGDMLNDIRTLGFRGEALPSIAAVAKVEMRTRTRDAQSGTLVGIHGGVWQGMSDIGCAEGTAITVKELFYNLPARKAFLRKPAYEAGVVYDTVTKMMLGNPQVSIRLINNEKTVAHSFGDGSIRNAALAAFGRDYASSMEEIDVSEGAFRIRGLVGMGDLARGNRSMQAFFINGRTVRCNMLTYALEQATKERVGIGMHPICALHVTVPPATIDVNVHPSKLEIRFRDEEAFRTTAQTLLQNALSKDTLLDIPSLIEQKKVAEEEPPKPVPEIPVVQMTVSEKLNMAKELSEQQDEQRLSDAQYYAHLRSTVLSQPRTHVLRERSKTDIFDAWLKADEQQETPKSAPQEGSIPPAVQKESPAQTPEKEKPEHVEEQEQMRMETVAPQSQPAYRIIGVALRTYLLLEVDDALVLIDQHAAHERILYEKYKSRLDLGTASQRLLLPVIKHVTPKELALIEENMATLSDAGYEIEPFGKSDIRINAVPFILGKADYSSLLVEMIETLGELKAAQLAQRLQSVISLSCRKAIKGGDALTDAEISALVDEMLASKAPPTCPHGRPVARVITRKELERMFWRA